MNVREEEIKEKEEREHRGNRYRISKNFTTDCGQKKGTKLIIIKKNC